MWDRQFGIRRVTVIGEKARNNYSSMAELGHKVSGQPRESFGLCVSLTFLGNATQTAVEIPPSAARTSFLSLDGDMKEALCVESGEQRTKPQTLQLLFAFSFCFEERRVLRRRRTAKVSWLYLQYMAWSASLIFFANVIMKNVIIK